MKKALKTYYQINFGAFSSITAAAIELINTKESWTGDLPACIHFTGKPPSPAAIISRKHLQAKIMKAFKLIQN